ncbi:sulfonate ABC transporter substrate-binding protein [Nostoc linckia z18]|uniref:Sulfonate ABC transporter substrate-binding protein n=2 Tax=Nostoc linckia TaxID=92942 RepID=A0ABX4KQF2_NOSLI|nr:sulfonate ABC transporter substrate-binding protein [Nostoc linckia z1]PHJ71426.1 sulfonate ABC transporter substrate-binding protein [Nostoc linckia z3]PHJ75456.1 sulfonate ABC transporter substrate-binding protein [Nostoc linckia z2]PHJ84265.1 sulfonate ABC transporter substrate-binding protein [Nostoc linckia z4]PHJ90849.1 sulfonate ABC transporter substrate-binding protein [Nostoc linckia z6]PHJ97652.1 sulfonate ABC transporter substrate-binding protein [Nostoc linckia z7]PHK05857.1 su
MLSIVIPAVNKTIALFKKCKQQRIYTFSLMFTLGLGLTLTVFACSPTTSNSGTTPTTQASNNTVVRIGYQKASTILYALKAQGSLEKAFAASGASVTWSEFPAGPPMLEALNAGSIDFGYTGESPPIFAQAGGIPLVYVAYDPWSPKAEAIIVPKDSSIKSVAELKGKRVAFAKGSNANYLLVKALEKAGLQYSDIQPKTLAPADARAAFEGKNVEAWSIWDPYLAAAEAATGARILTDATGLAPNRGYYLAAKSFVDTKPNAVKTILDEVKKASDWAKNNPSEVAKLISPALGIDVPVLEIAEKRREYDVLPLTDEVINKQQEVADTFYQIKLIPKEIKVKEIVWQGN